MRGGRDDEARCTALEIRLKHHREVYASEENDNRELRKRIRQKKGVMSKRKRLVEKRIAVVEAKAASASNETEFMGEEELKRVTELVNELQDRLMEVTQKVQEYRAISESVASSFCPIADRISSSLPVETNGEDIRKVNSRALMKQSTLNRVMGELTLKMNRLQTKDDKLIEKLNRLRKVLSDPVDDFIMEQIVTEGIESELKMLERRQQQCRDEEFSIEMEKRKVSSLERKNAEKRQVIEQTKSSVNDHERDSRRISLGESRHKSSFTSSTLLLQDSLHSFGQVDTRLNSLSDRYSLYFSMEKEIKENVEEVEQEKRKNETQLAAKTARIDLLNQEYRKAREVTDQVVQLQQQNLNIKRTLKLTQVNKGQMSAGNRGVAKRMKLVESKRDDNSRLRFVVGVKEQTLAKQTEAAIRKRNVLLSRRRGIKEGIENMADLEKNVELLEEQVKLLEEKVQVKNAEVRKLVEERNSLVS